MKIGKLKNKELLKQGQEMETINQKFDEFELQESQYLSNLKKKLIEICDDLEIERSSDELQDISTALFRNGKNKKGVIARTLVLVSEDQELANLSDFRVNLCTYYDRQDELKNIYRNLSLSDDVQNHEKLVKLADIYQEVKEMFNKVVNTITSLETAISIREQYTSNLHNEYGKLFLDGYGISSLGSRERIKEFFNSVQNYKDSGSEDEKVENYQKFRQIYEQYCRNIEEHNSDFTQMSIQDPLKAVSDQGSSPKSSVKL